MIDESDEETTEEIKEKEDEQREKRGRKEGEKREKRGRKKGEKVKQRDFAISLFWAETVLSVLCNEFENCRVTCDNLAAQVNRLRNLLRHRMMMREIGAVKQSDKPDERFNSCDTLNFKRASISLPNIVLFSGLVNVSNIYLIFRAKIAILHPNA
jgi:hypothetical protein